MRYSKYFIPTVKEPPADADIVSQKLMHKAGMARRLASGIYEWLPLGLKVLKKVEEIIRQEMNAAGGQELWFPALLPKELFEETGRWGVYGKELMRLKDRNNREFALGPTHEEIITDLVRHEVRSYKELPLMFYQFQNKFRDEIRPRFGVMRAREFYMKDAYSFHADQKDAQDYYSKVYDAYSKIFTRCGLKFRAVEALTGAIGGSFSHEFMVIASTGEEGIVSCECGYGANTEKAEFSIPKASGESKEKAPELEEVHTPGQKTVEELINFMKSSSSKFIKTLIYLADGSPVIALIRGDREINDKKLQELLGVSELFLADETAILKVTGAPTGFAGPARLKGRKEIEIVADNTLKNMVNAVSGANKKDYHIQGLLPTKHFNAEWHDIRKVKDGDSCPKCGNKLRIEKAIEVGNIFKLGTKYSVPLNAVFLDKDGKEKPIIMGSYGIGSGRLLACIAEEHHDDKGLIWPITVSPYCVHLIQLSGKENKIVRQTAEKVYSTLLQEDIEVLYDDRDESPGVKFNDADLIGIPIRLIVSERALDRKGIEFKLRKSEMIEIIPIDQIITRVKSLIDAIYAEIESKVVSIPFEE